MSRNNAVFRAPPVEVENVLKQLGARLRSARLARNLSMDHVAAKLGVGRRVIATAEAGKPGTAVGVYVSLLWLYGLAAQMNDVADPARDETTMRTLAQRSNAYPSRKGALDNDF